MDGRRLRDRKGPNSQDPAYRPARSHNLFHRSSSVSDTPFDLRLSRFVVDRYPPLFPPLAGLSRPTDGPGVLETAHLGRLGHAFDQRCFRVAVGVRCETHAAITDLTLLEREMYAEAEAARLLKLPRGPARSTCP